MTGKRGKAVLGQYLGSKYLVYGFDLVCIGRDGEEKWRMVEDGWDVRVKYILDHNGDYIEVERYGNEVVKDPNGIMPDKPIRYRPKKKKGEKLFYSPEHPTGSGEYASPHLRNVCRRMDHLPHRPAIGH